MDDVIRTVDNSVTRMNRLLAQLRCDVASTAQTSCVDLAQLLNEIVQVTTLDGHHQLSRSRNTGSL